MIEPACRTAPPQLSPRLLRNYRATRYSADGIEIRIGRRSATVDGLLARHGARSAVLVTAWNPLSLKRPDGWNRRMQCRLRQHSKRAVVLSAEGALGQWREAHLLVLAPLPWVNRLARQFRQNAVVSVSPGRKARLVLLP